LPVCSAAGGLVVSDDDGHLRPVAPDGAHCRRRRSSAVERDVDLRGEVVADLPVALCAQFPDFDPAPPAAAAAATLSVADRRLAPAAPVDATALAAVGGHRPAVSDCRLLMPGSGVARYCYTPPISRSDIQIKCLRWLRDAERQEQ